MLTRLLSVLLLILSVCPSISGFASPSNPRIDSLLQILNSFRKIDEQPLRYVNNQSSQGLRMFPALLNQNEKYDKILLLTKIAREYLIVDYDSCLRYLKSGFEIAQSVSDRYWMTKFTYSIGELLRRKGKLDEAMPILLESFDVAHRHGYYDIEKYASNSLGISYAEVAKFDLALKYLLASLELRQVEKNVSEVTVSLNNVGLVYFKLKSYETASSYFEKSISLKDSIGDYYDYERVLTNLTLSYINMGKLEPAATILSDLKTRCNDICNDALMMEIYYAAGELSWHSGNITEALDYYKRSKHLSKSANKIRFYLTNIHAIGNCYLSLGDLNKAVAVLQQVRDTGLSASVPNLELMKIYRTLYQALDRQGKTIDASFYKSKYIALKDSLYSEEMASKLMEIESKHLEIRNRGALEAHAKIIALKAKALDSQETVSFLLLVTAMCLVTTVVLLWRSILRKRVVHDLLTLKFSQRTRQLAMKQTEIDKLIDQYGLNASNVSNMLRTNLVSIQGICEIGIRGTSDPTATECLEYVKEIVDRMTTSLFRQRDPVDNTI